MTLPLMSGRLLQGMSETFETLHNLVHKGVKVVMDIPYELWNETSAEVADLKKQVQALQLSGVGGPHRAVLLLRKATKSWGTLVLSPAWLQFPRENHSHLPALRWAVRLSQAPPNDSQCWGFANSRCCG